MLDGPCQALPEPCHPIFFRVMTRHDYSESHRVTMLTYLDHLRKYFLEKSPLAFWKPLMTCRCAQGCFFSSLSLSLSKNGSLDFSSLTSGHAQDCFFVEKMAPRFPTVGTAISGELVVSLPLAALPALHRRCRWPCLAINGSQTGEGSTATFLCGGGGQEHL